MTEITERDREILAFISEFKCVNSDIIAQLFFSDANNKVMLANRRLRKLFEIGKLNRSKRTDILEPYLYYKGSKPSNYKHSLLIAKAYIDISNKYEIVKYKREYEVKYNNKTLRADLMAIAKDDKGKLRAFIIEIQNAKQYKNKWSEYISNGYYKAKFGVEPEIIVYSRFSSYTSSIPIEFIKIE